MTQRTDVQTGASDLPLPIARSRETQAGPPLTEDTIAQIEKFYPNGAPEDVLRFLSVYPFLVLLVLEARKVIIKYFGPARVDLKMFTDPEDGTTQLLIEIVLPIPPQEAIARWDEFTDAWWLDRLADAQGHLSINLTYR